MKRIVTLIALLAMMTLLVTGLAGCGGSEGGGTDTMKDPAAGNWYIVDGSDITTLKLDGTGGGSLGGDSISYSLDGDTVSLTIDGETVDVTMGDSEYGEVLKDDEGVIFAYRDKSAAKEIAAGGGGDNYAEAILGDWYMPNEGELFTLTFEADGKLTLNGTVPMTYTLSDDKVTMEANGETYDLWIADEDGDGWVLEEANGDIAAWKDQSIAQTHVKQETQAATDLGGKEKYVGNWIGDSFTYSGVDMSLSEANMTFSIKIDADGTATAMTNGEADGSASWVYNDDGTITLTDGTGELPDHSYIDDAGKLHLGLNADDGTMWIICHKE